jgi:hypothetical protein
METIEITRLDNDRWRWQYSDGNGARILSNDVYPSRAEARTAAAAAYPDLERSLLDEGPNAEASRQRARSWKLLALVLIALLTIALGWWLADRRDH